MALLTVEDAAERMGVTPRFVRRLIAEKRITYVKLGSHVRIEDTVVDEFIAVGRVEAVPRQIPLAYPQIARDEALTRSAQQKV
jgi:excisionase family DNA binding protein